MGNRLIKGFTLVELMVAMSLLSMIILVGSMSYSVFIESWSKVNHLVNQNIRKAKNLMLLRKTVNSTMSYMLTNNSEKSGLLFNGDQLSFLSITTSPIFNDEYPSFYQIAFEPSKKSTDGRDVGRLIYRELSSKENYVINIDQLINFEHEMLLFDDISNFKVVYLAWPYYQDKLQVFDEESKPKRWINTYNSFNSLILPEAISIQFTDNKNEQHILYFDLIDGSEKLSSRSLGAENDA